MKHFVVTAALALLAATASAQADTNLLVNGSFEQAGPSFAAAGSYCYLGYAPLECGSLPGWSGKLPVIASSSGAWGIPSGLSGWDSAQGDILIGLQNTSYAVQNVGLAAGIYALTWSDAGRSNYGSGTSYIVSFDGQDLGTYSTTLGQGWATHTLAFTAAGAGDLRCQGLSINADGTAFVDNVRLTAAVPEPASLVLILAGLVSIGLAARRTAGWAAVSSTTAARPCPAA